MYICICKGVTERAIREQVFAGARSVDEVSRRTGCSTQCGKCLMRAERVVSEACSGVSAHNASYAAPLSV
ncbi:MAG: (2Fe-2S)-binding protein [Luminiphilus sp.]|nr:(2Fe-2S)-binding protein [Luminiphilus sp.]MDG1682886.1 (2Fe-2S)-binding protein [Luminiphilus sp.]